MSTADSNPIELRQLHPPATMPGGEIQVAGRHLGPRNWRVPRAFVGDTPAHVALSRSERLVVRIPHGSVSGELKVAHGEDFASLPLAVAVPIAVELHTVSNPVADSLGNIFVAYSGPRGERVLTSVFRIDAEYNQRPHATEIMNATGLALDANENLYVSSRHEGTIYRISPEGTKTVYAEGMGIATGLAFDTAGNLYCGDRSGTIFKIAPDRQIFVFATLEPSVAAFHLCMGRDGTLFVTAPTTGSLDNVYAINTAGDTRIYYAGLGRPQGMAISASGDLLVAGSLHGARGVVRITARGQASLAVAGPGIVGMANLVKGGLALATNDAVYLLRP